MHISRATVAGALLVLAALTACTTDPAPRDATPPPARSFDPQAVGSEDPTRTGPAAPVDGATPGGTLTVHLPAAPGPDTLDPSGAWSGVGNPIQQALVSRSLTQYVSGADGEPVLVPDLATDLGRPNANFTSWTFTIRDDATWEDGAPVTPQEVAFGICRSLDTTVFHSGPGTEYSKPYFEGGEDYDGPYTGEDPDCDRWSGITVDGQDITIEMAVPFPEMDHYAAVLAMGPARQGAASDPARWSQRPMATGPYRVESWEPEERLVLVRNHAWRADSDPGRHAYADRWVFEFSQDQATVDEIMLSGNEASRRAVSTSLGADHYRDAAAELGDRLVQQSTQCVATITPDYRKITDIRVRKALAYAFPYQDSWIAGGDVPGVTRAPAGSLMPPGMPGRVPFQVDGEQITYDPERSRELLAEAGLDEPYPITMAYDQTDARATAMQEQVTIGLEAGGFSVRAIPVQQSIYSVWLDPDNAVNRRLNLRGVVWCPSWPSGSALLPPLLGSGAPYNTAHFSEPEADEAMAAIAHLPSDQQDQAWGALDRRILETWFPIIPVAYLNRLFVFGDQVGNPSGDGAAGVPDYRDLYVVQ